MHSIVFLDYCLEKLQRFGMLCFPFLQQRTKRSRRTNQRTKRSQRRKEDFLNDEDDDIIQADDEDEDESDDDNDDEEDEEFSCDVHVSFNMIGKEDPNFSPEIDSIKKAAASQPVRRSSR